MIKKVKTTIEKIFKTRLSQLIFYTFCAILLLFFIYLIYRSTGFGFKCLLFEITGLKCPGCGNTRAVSSLLDFNFLTALSYNYLFPIEFLYIVWVYLVSAKRFLTFGKFNYKSPCNAIEIIFLILVLGWFPIRNIFNL